MTLLTLSFSLFPKDQIYPAEVDFSSITLILSPGSKYLLLTSSLSDLQLIH